MNKAIQHEDPRLTAYALGELSREESAEMEKIIANDPELQKEVENIDALSLMLSEVLSNNEHVKLSPNQRATIYQSGRTPTSEDIISIHKKQWLRPLIVTLGAAALLTLSFVWLNNMAGRHDLRNNVNFSQIKSNDLTAPVIPNDSEWTNQAPAENGISTVSSTIPTSPKSNSIDNMGEGLMHHPIKIRQKIQQSSSLTAKEEPAKITENPWESRASNAMTRIPLVCGNSSWKWIEEWTSNKRQGPLNKNTVRIEEILNHFSYSNPADIRIGNLHTGVTIVQCPWNPNTQVAVILVQNQSNQEAYAEAAVTMGESVEKYRLLGYAKATQENTANMAPTMVKLAPDYSHLCIFEIELHPDTEIGDDILALSLNSKSHISGKSYSNTLNIQHSDLAWSSSPQDVQFSLLVASWAQLISNSAFNHEMNAEKLKGMIQSFELNGKPSAAQDNAISIMQQSLD